MGIVNRYKGLTEYSINLTYANSELKISCRDWRNPEIDFAWSELDPKTGDEIHTFSWAELTEAEKEFAATQLRWAFQEAS